MDLEVVEWVRHWLTYVCLLFSQVLSAYSVTKSRLILLDVDLLIRPKEETADSYRDGVIRSLEQLVEERGNYVFLLSNETQENLLKWLGNMSNLEKIGLAAEDGCLSHSMLFVFFACCCLSLHPCVAPAISPLLSYGFVSSFLCAG